MLDWRGQAELLIIFVEFEADGLDGEFVIVALGQAGDGDAADDACALDANGEAAAVGGVVDGGEPLFFFERGVRAGELATDGVRAAVEARYDVDFAADPLGLIGDCAGKRAVEELLAEAADIDGETATALDGERAEARAEVPGGGFVEGFEDKFRFLAGDGGEIVVGIHVGTFYSECDGEVWFQLQSKSS